MRRSDLNALFTEEHKEPELEYLRLEISSKIICDCFNKAIESYRPEWELKRTKEAKTKQKRENDRIAAVEAAAQVEGQTTQNEGRVQEGGRIISTRLRNALKRSNQSSGPS